MTFSLSDEYYANVEGCTTRGRSIRTSIDQNDDVLKKVWGIFWMIISFYLQLWEQGVCVLYVCIPRYKLIKTLKNNEDLGEYC